VKVTVTVCPVEAGLTVKVFGLTVNCDASAPARVMPDTMRAALPVLPTVRVSVLF